MPGRFAFEQIETPFYSIPGNHDCDAQSWTFDGCAARRKPDLGRPYPRPRHGNSSLPAQRALKLKQPLKLDAARRCLILGGY